MSHPLELSLSEISKTFRPDVFKKPFRALDNVSCKFPSAKCTGLLGHNGAGKTTSIRMILGLIQPDSGSVRLNENEIKIADRSAIGFVPEVNKLAVNLTCFETLDLHTRLYPLEGSQSRKSLVNQHLEKVGLAKFANKQIRHLSKGMARRLAWAQAVIHKPKLLILDEPFSGLDPIGRRDMNEWIREQKSSGVTIVLCTHDLWTVESLCDEINILNRGRLVFSSLNDHSARSTNSIESYQVEISGASKVDIDSILKNLKIQQNAKVFVDGFLSKLTFDRYQEAGLFVQTCINSGLIVNRFGQTPLWDSQKILSYFDQDSNNSNTEKGK